MENMNYNREGMNAAAAAPTRHETKPKAPTRFNLKDFLMMLLVNWYWFIISGAVAFGAAWLYYQTLQPQYQRVTDLQIKFHRTDDLDMGSYLGIADLGVTNMSNELYILQSLKLAGEVSKALHLDVFYFKEGTFRRQYLYQDRPFIADFKDEFLHHLIISVRPESTQEFYLTKLIVNGKETAIPNPEQLYKFGEEFKLPTEERLTLTVGDTNYPSLVGNIDQEIFVERCNDALAAYRCQAMTSTESRASSMVRISCIAPSVAEADAILQGYIDAYNAQTLEEKNALTISSMAFVEERIAETARELGETESKLFDFGIDPDAEPSSAKSVAADLIDSRLKAQDSYNAIMAQLNAAKDIRSRVGQAVSSKDYVPVLPGLQEAGVQGQITAYNSQIQQRNRLIANSSIDNPAVRRIDVALETMEMTLRSTLDSYVETLASEARQASSRVARYASAAKPDRKSKYDSTSIETKSLSIMREYKQSYFSFLLKKREELRLQLAVSEADTRIIEDPMGDTSPISPIASSIYIKFIGVGLALPAVFLFLIVFFNNTVRGRRDIEEVLTIPFIGEVPGYKPRNLKTTAFERFMAKVTKKPIGIKSNKIVIKNSSKNALAEGFHIVQSNLSFITDSNGKRPQVLLFTSFAPGAGKSFVSVNLASCLSNTEKRSIWIDMDIRKGHKNPLLFKEGECPSRRIGLSSYLVGKAELDQCIFESAANDHLDILPAGPIPPNPVQLLMSEKLAALIEDLRKKYEYIIIDSVPASVIADAMICSRLSDLQIYVIRAGVTDRNVLPEIEKLYQQRKFQNLCCM
ncbi:MAG: polysaccharide biosynthesis tyrosine autokinase, partial [Bacteroidales bacterium]|nr:polysaccharide biosynthesis tyrosine autokinase [Bacteroidales bacterium]